MSWQRRFDEGDAIDVDLDAIDVDLDDSCAGFHARTGPRHRRPGLVSITALAWAPAWQ